MNTKIMNISQIIIIPKNRTNENNHCDNTFNEQRVCNILISSVIIISKLTNVTKLIMSVEYYN